MTMKKRSWILLMAAALAIQACTGWGQGQRAKIDLPAHAAATAPRRDAPVVIVGAGLCGLTLAHELKKAGIDALLVEATPRIGAASKRSSSPMAPRPKHTWRSMSSAIPP
jgi:monoamine oxidase